MSNLKVVLFICFIFLRDGISDFTLYDHDKNYTCFKIKKSWVEHEARPNS